MGLSFGTRLWQLFEVLGAGLKGFGAGASPHSGSGLGRGSVWGG